MIFLAGIGTASFIVADAEHFWIVVPKLAKLFGNRSKIPYPVHGFGGNGNVWSDDYKVVQFFKNMELNYGGILRFDSSGRKVISDSKHRGYDFFAVSFSNNLDSVKDQAKELEKAVTYVRRKTGSSEVVLVAFSMGGLTSRQYLVTHPENHHVKKLVTIGTPHKGSPLSLVYDFKMWAKVNSQTLGTAVFSINAIQEIFNNSELDSDDVRSLFSNTISLLSTASRGFSGKALLKILQEVEERAQDFFMNPELTADVPALADLRPPRDSDYTSYLEGLFPSGTFLYELNEKEHPDIEYACVIGEVGLNADTLDRMYDELLDSQNTSSMDSRNFVYIYLIGNMIINLFKEHADTIVKINLFSGSDGVVSTDSQNLNNIPFFKRHPGSVSEIWIRKNVVHLEECWHHEKIKEAIGTEYLRLAEN